MIQLWVDKYAPKRIEELIGHGKSKEELKLWADSWEKGKTQKPLLISGPTGIGKTAVVIALVNEYGWEILELNASNLRNADKINRIAGNAAISRTFSGKLRLILFDEVDGMYRSDRGGSGAVYKILKQAECPVILTANNVWDSKLSSIRNFCNRIDMKRVHYATIANYLAEIASKEKVDVEKEVLMSIARNCSGDVRSAINDLQLLAQGIEKISERDLEVLGERDRKGNIFNTVRTILKTRDFDKSRNSLRNLNESPDFVLKWIDENVPKEYKRPEDLYKAYERISRADVFLGRVMKRQDYGLWRYVSILMSSGVSLSKEKTYPGFTRYAFPSLIRGLSASKPERRTRKNIGLKIGEQCHVSSSRAIQDYLPMFQELMKDKNKALRLAAQFDFTEEELKFLGVKGPKKVFDKAQDMRTEYIKESSRIIRGKNQRGLQQF